MERIKVSAVSYVNSYPFIFGLRQQAICNEIDLELDHPADCARKLLNGEVDLGLVPVAIIPEMESPVIVTNMCIGAEGEVESVCLFSEVPLSEIDEILLDYQSRTSVQLARVLAERYWKINPKWTDGKNDFISKIAGKTAGVVIGDRAFGLKNKHPVVRDLAGDWKSLTGLPFVFACWVSNKTLSPDFVSKFNKALTYGLQNKEAALEYLSASEHADMKRYVNDVISYDLDEKKLKAMKLFHLWSGNAIEPFKADVDKL